MALPVNIYSIVKQILTESESARNSDKALIWLVWQKQGLTRPLMTSECIFWRDFKTALSPESIARARRKICERYPELKGNPDTEKIRQAKAEQKGLFIYDPLQGKSTRLN